jgi:hypothetical protein
MLFIRQSRQIGAALNHGINYLAKCESNSLKNAAYEVPRIVPQGYPEKSAPRFWILDRRTFSNQVREKT